ncbi:helicase [Phaeovibrio sulfidiphilus]|uniref:Helicase n=1 Tax=Phaeovibrio sulfidiphilus TaxID=1220600 RepID=A0A8J6YUS3_9PROT|nr:helicase-related protein [Phaeovibrio sulfidiphilus]MBE1236794.1 helicase [Phaeovibrio sulfidiphilus]
MVSRVCAVLGPTNTGKTYLAMERMLAHASGMIGFPLRLLARENYDRAVRLVGAGAVALITGEEKILPPRARYFVCTVESMPVNRSVEFLAIDEIQLCGDPERGHIFTDRLLNARGTGETMFLGAESMAGLIRRLVPGCTFDTRTRFSRLSYTGANRVTRLPRRSAVVAFSADEVYALAEMFRRQSGGAAVVMGALSPRTRNAQVELYQSGQVDYLVATDAIGMGLNMDIDHVAFGALEKFDGTDVRSLTAQEVAQIAGRAGRYRKDGTFGTTAGARPIPEDVIERVESHTFAPQQRIFWRNSVLDFRSVESLLKSLNRPPPEPGLVRAPTAGDQAALELLSGDSEIAARASSPSSVALLWDVCRIPDFRRLRSQSHTRLQMQVFTGLSAPGGRLDDDFVAGRVRRVDRTDGDIHTLVDRIAAIRVWTYIAHQSGWLKDSAHWQGLTRSIEDRLSDALHERLTQRFVDRCMSVLMRRLKECTMPDVEILAADGRVLVEKDEFGRLEGLAFRSPAPTGSPEKDQMLLTAARPALEAEIQRRLGRLLGDDDAVFSLDANGRILWRGDEVGHLGKGPTPLEPVLVADDNPFLGEPGQQKLLEHLNAWFERQFASRLEPLAEMRKADLSGVARGLVYQILENLGTLLRGQGEDQVDQMVRALTEEDRRALGRLRVRLGVGCLFVPGLLKPTAQSLLATLWRIHNGNPGGALPPDGRVSFVAAPDVPESFYLAMGYRLMGTKAIRVDMLERFAADVRRLIRETNEARKADAAAPATDGVSADAAAGEGAAVPASAEASEATPDSGDGAGAVPQEPAGPSGDADAVPLAAEGPDGSADAARADAPEAAAPTAEGAEGTAEGTEGAAEGADAPVRTPAVPRPGEVVFSKDILPQLGIDIEDGEIVLQLLGYRTRMEDGSLFVRPKRRGVSKDRPERGNRRRGPQADAQGERGDARPRKEGDAGRPRRDRDEGRKGPGDGRKRGKPGAHDGARAGRKPSSFSSAPAPREREPDPDSPFAVLGALLKR